MGWGGGAIGAMGKATELQRGLQSYMCMVKKKYIFFILWILTNLLSRKSEIGCCKILT